MPQKKNRPRDKQQQQKRLAAQKTQLSPVHPQVEKRLEKLEKLTVGSSVLQNALARRAELSPEPLQGMQAADQRNAPIPFFPKPTSISGSEAEFLSRQRSIEDASQVSQLTGHELVETAPVMGGNSNGFAGYYDGGSADPLQTLTEALRERVHSLEKQLQAQTKVLQKKETELEKKDNKVKLLSQELQQLRHDAANDIRRLQSEVLALSHKNSLTPFLSFFSILSIETPCSLLLCGVSSTRWRLYASESSTVKTRLPSSWLRMAWPARLHRPREVRRRMPSWKATKS